MRDDRLDVVDILDQHLPNGLLVFRQGRQRWGRRLLLKGVGLSLRWASHDLANRPEFIENVLQAGNELGFALSDQSVRPGRALGLINTTGQSEHLTIVFRGESSGD